MTTETTTAAGQTGETRSLIVSDIAKGTPVYRPNGDRIGGIEGVMVTEATRKIVYAVVSFGGHVSFGPAIPRFRGRFSCTVPDLKDTAQDLRHASRRVNLGRKLLRQGRPTARVAARRRKRPIFRGRR